MSAHVFVCVCVRARVRMRVFVRDVCVCVRARVYVLCINIFINFLGSGMVYLRYSRFHVWLDEWQSPVFCDGH
jgi:hypothetical protein